MAFHPYPQLIPPVFNLGGYGPPQRLTTASTWPWVDHPVSGLEHATKKRPNSDSLSLHLPHNGLSKPHATNSQAHSSKGTPSPQHPPHKNMRQTPTGSDGLKAPGFRNYFTPLPGYFSPFPHGTNTLSVIKKYSGLPSGLGRFTQDSTSPALLGHKPSKQARTSPTRLSRSTVSHPRLFNYTHSLTPHHSDSMERFAPQHRMHNPR